MIYKFQQTIKLIAHSMQAVRLLVGNGRSDYCHWQQDGITLQQIAIFISWLMASTSVSPLKHPCLLAYDEGRLTIHGQEWIYLWAIEESWKFHSFQSVLKFRSLYDWLIDSFFVFFLIYQKLKIQKYLTKNYLQ